MAHYAGRVPKDWLREQIIIMQTGGRYARRIAAVELADMLLPALRRMAISQQRRLGLTIYSQDKAEDAVSQAYFVFLTRLHTFKEPYDLMAWFRVVLRNLLEDERRWLRRFIYTSEQFVFDSKVYDQTSVLSIAELVRELVCALPREQAIAVRMYYWENIDPAAIAAHFGVTRQAITGRIDRAHRRLRTQLRERGITRDGWADTNTS